MEKIKTLVIHPQDSSTQFLDKIYKNEDWTVVTDLNISKSNLRSLIQEHDRIICLGHGTGEGLMDLSGRNCRLIIDSTLVYLLREKDLVLIWCNADEFGRKYGLNGFITGMIISEVEEAIMFCIPATAKEIEESNMLFTESIAKTIHGTPKMIMEGGLEIYKGDSAVIAFNRDNFHAFYSYE